MKVYEVRESDGTSFSGVSKSVGFYLSRENADTAAARIKEHNSWNEGYVREHEVLDADQERSGASS